MTLTHILIFSAAALVAGFIRSPDWRGRILLTLSILSLYWLQPATPIRHLDFWLPTAALGLTVLVWGVSEGGSRRFSDSAIQQVSGSAVSAFSAVELIGRQIPLLWICGLPLLVGLTRYLGPVCCLTPSRPPEIWQILLALGLIVLLSAGLIRFSPHSSRLATVLIFLLIAFFLVLKTDPWAKTMSGWLRVATGQPIEPASPLDLRWLGYSYLAFRLLHTLRDAQMGRLPASSLQEYLIYALFFPAYTAGPIDRLPRFLGDLRQPFTLSAETLLGGGQRLMVGLFRKFVLADSLALVALNGVNAAQTTSSGWLWVLLYAYTFRIYFDFSGYTDIVLGLGQLMGVRLPENFARPYLQPNLTAFWNSWHITLAQWFRAYFFNPVTRALRGSPRNIPLPLIILAGQLGTMALIGLWHGVTWNFVAWGVWHAAGLFVHNRWSGATKARFTSLAGRPRLQRALSIAGTLLTFHYVTLGWVWFALPNLNVAWEATQKLFGG